VLVQRIFKDKIHIIVKKAYFIGVIMDLFGKKETHIVLEIVYGLEIL